MGACLPMIPAALRVGFLFNYLTCFMGVIAGASPKWWLDGVIRHCQNRQHAFKLQPKNQELQESACASTCLQPLFLALSQTLPCMPPCYFFSFDTTLLHCWTLHVSVYFRLPFFLHTNMKLVILVIIQLICINKLELDNLHFITYLFFKRQINDSIDRHSVIMKNFKNS